MRKPEPWRSRGSPNSPGLRGHGTGGLGRLGLVLVVHEGFYGHQAVVAVGTPPTNVEVEERRMVIVKPILVRLGHITDHTPRGGGDGGTAFAIDLDELDADNALVHLVASKLGKLGDRLEIGAGVNHFSKRFRSGLINDRNPIRSWGFPLSYITKIRLFVGFAMSSALFAERHHLADGNRHLVCLCDTADRIDDSIFAEHLVLEVKGLVVLGVPLLSKANEGFGKGLGGLLVLNVISGKERGGGGRNDSDIDIYDIHFFSRFDCIQK